MYPYPLMPFGIHATAALYITDAKRNHQEVFTPVYQIYTCYY